MTLILNQRRTRQPQYPVGIDWGNPVTRGLVFATAENNPTLDAVTGKLGSLSGTPPVLTPSTRGIAAKGVGTGHYSFGTRADIGPSGTDKITVFVLADNINDTSCSGMFVSKTETLYNFRLGVNSGPQQFAFGVASVAEVVMFPTSSMGALAPYGSRVVPVAGVYDGANAAIFVDGLRRATVAKTGTFQAPGDAFSVLSRGDSGERLSGASVLFVAIWNRALSDAEIKSLSDNPWQIFSPAVT